MKNFIRTIFSLILGLTIFNAYSSQPTTFLGPTLRGGYTDTITNNTAYSVAAEAGIKDLRVGGTLGWRLCESQRIKLSGEYLWQKLTYHFFTGDTQQWMKQGAIGALYEYEIFYYPLRPQFDLGGYYSQAPSKNLGTVTGSLTNSAGIIQTFIDNRRIAGSRAGGVAPGVSIQPWWGARVGADLNYDDVIYDKRNSPPQNARGFGGTARFDQALTRHLGFGLLAGIRQPFNNYQANLNWTTYNRFGEWVIGLDTAYTTGKNSMPNTYNIGISINFLADHRTGCVRKCECVCRENEFKNWIAKPAVYMPQVLADPDEKITPTCSVSAPTFSSSSPISNMTFEHDGAPHTFSTAGSFIGSDLIFVVTTGTLNPGMTITINRETGAITVQNTGSTSTASVNVTATNCAGSVTSNTFNVTA